MKTPSSATNNETWQRFDCLLSPEGGKGYRPAWVMSKTPLVKGSIVLIKKTKWVVLSATLDGTRPQIGDVLNLSKK